MGKKYLDINVYDATQERLKFIFEEFNYVYVSFSGGKDSGVLIELVIDYIKKNNLDIRVGVLVIDLEAQYKLTIEYIDGLLNKYKEYIDLYYVCLPLNLRNAVSNYIPYWCCWESGVDWVRQMPSYAINIDNHQFDFYKHRMEFEEFVPLFGKWLAKKHGKTACLVGIRADESLNRFRTINSKTKTTYKNTPYSTKIDDNIYNLYPIYDWRVEDIWVYNQKFSKTYNKIYDKFYYSGVTLSNMRICQPYGDDQRIGLNLYKELEFDTWQKLLLRVAGVNSGSLYAGTKFLGYNGISLPNNHTWKSYTKFLLNTLPAELKQQYIKKFKTYIKYWYKNGSALGDELIEKLKEHNVKYKENGISNRGLKNKKSIRLLEIKDDIKDNSIKQDVATWRRMAMCIIKNDVMCKSLSFGQTKDDIFKKINKIKTANNWSNDND